MHFGAISRRRGKSISMRYVTRLVASVLLYGGFGLCIAAFSNAPTYRHADPGSAFVKLSFSHAAARREACRRLSPEDVAALPPNMRRPMACSRERVDVRIEFAVDAERLFAADLTPAGLARDGEATVYHKFAIEPGAHVLEVQLRDTPRVSGYDYSARHEIVLDAGQLLVVDFDAKSGGFRFR